MIHVANPDTKFAAGIVTPSSGPVQPQRIQEESKKGDVEMIDTSSAPKLQKSPSKNKQAPLTDQEVKKAHCNHGPNAKCINCLGITKENIKEVKHTCNHSPLQKCPNCISGDKEDKFVKHESFEAFLSELKSKCKGKHQPDQKCQNCVPFSQFSYKVNYKCPNHKPFPEGMCNKCLPPAVVLKRQIYRHVDYVSFMNFIEMSSFVNYWQQSSGCMEQRMAWLYGYYSEDPNYPEGVRVNIEAIYEPV